MMRPEKRSREASLREMRDGDSSNKRGKGREHWTVADYRWDARLPSSDRGEDIRPRAQDISEHPDYRVFKMAWSVGQTRIHFDKIESDNEIKISRSKDLLSKLKLSAVSGGYDTIMADMEQEKENNYFIQSIVSDINKEVKPAVTKKKSEVMLSGRGSRNVRRMVLDAEKKFDEFIKKDKKMLEVAKESFDGLSKAIEEVDINGYNKVESIINAERSRNRYLEEGIKLTEKHFFSGEIIEESPPINEVSSNQQVDSMEIDLSDNTKDSNQENNNMEID